MKSPSNIRRTTLLGALSAVALPAGLMPRRANAAEFPGSQPIKIVVPATAGGSADIVARLISNHMASQLKTPIVVDNVSGAGGTVGAARVARAAADGHTLMLGFTSNVETAPMLVRNLPYDPIRDFAPVGRAVTVSLCVVATPELQVANMKELIALAKSRAGTAPVMYGAWGNGSAAHLTMEGINLPTKAGMKMIPYKSEADVQRALLGNEVLVGPQTVGLLLPHLRSGKFKALGIAAKKRSVLLPDVPTLAEQGIPFDLSAWLGLFAPAGTSEPVLDSLAGAMQFALRQPDVVERMRAIGMEVDTISRQEFVAAIPKEIAIWRQLIQSAGVQAE
ncbi:tripartite-type tricarboxylate transporter receptor subunit TctC [Variovorax boronicumulans]|uniref:Tripartite-type tricarboxylate transporter receptor subunit TctC n=1 Tax=Variovorax boronicumulans TaxID=436515 RepID=A0AAW8DTS9_9BURK|nr:tripartite tricarboxylate transporter substrate binding protein [Variovorax boronicumulans]MDP9877660.1 tripartite-type tricarboxylate transporter receptor subunit TctC [Variovorax boronicumulans]MDP9922945.1 tripartite-type tricarboxylate transporter receptor subunit TctC [Variovorax boronicumulans]